MKLYVDESQNSIKGIQLEAKSAHFPVGIDSLPARIEGDGK